MAFNPKTFKTLEFLLLALSNVSAWLLVIVDYIPGSWGIYATALSGAGYALWRGLAKGGADVKDYWHTTEFYVALMSSAPNVIGAFADVMDPMQFGVVQSFIVMATGIAMGLRKQPDVAAGNVSAADLEAEGNLFVTDKDPDEPDGDDSIHAGLMAGAPPAVDPDADVREPDSGA